MKKRLKKIKKPINTLALIVCLLIVYFVAFLGSIFTSSGIKSSWYESIKPSITPPNWIFPIVWNALFFLIALSLYFAWTSAKKKDRLKIGIVFGLNLIFNALWSLLYFGMQNPLFAFFDIIEVWLTIILIMAVVWKINKTSFYLLIPYFIWVSFASILNYLSI